LAPNGRSFTNQSETNMNAKTLFFGGLILSLTTFACAAQTDTQDEPQAASSEEDLSGRAEIKGAWRPDSKAFDQNEAWVFHSDGTFIHDQSRILNGVLIAGGPPPGRDIGKFSVSKSKGTVTLTVTEGWHSGDSEVYDFKYTAAPILNGVFLPGHEPTATLELTHPPPTNGSKIAYPTITFKMADSYCNGLPNVSTNDCDVERKEGIWTPAEDGVSSCNVTKNECEVTKATN
jgi:hypothetical protein